MLRERFGRRVTLVDGYALDAAHAGVAVEDLASDDRLRLVDEVVPVLFASLERAARAGWGTDPVEIVEWQPEWAARFALWRERLATELGDVARRIEHVGSSAVRGLAAKPVVDVQISVADV